MENREVEEGVDSVDYECTSCDNKTSLSSLPLKTKIKCNKCGGVMKIDDIRF